jgi:putative ABC transport system permease protein
MRLYRALLTLYPRSFRAEYGGEMCAVFEQRRRAAGRPAQRVRVWFGEVAGLLANAAAVHWDLARQDLRFTARALRRTPGFALTAVLVIALGVGANTAAFSVADFVLVRPLPYPDSDRLVKLWERVPEYQVELSPANYRDWRAASTVFESMGAYLPIEVNLVGEGDPERLPAASVTSDILTMLGVTPALGRVFAPADDREGAVGTVVLSYGVWQSRFGGDGAVLGRRLLLDGEPHVVIGVMPPGFHFPSREIALWRPMPLRPDDYEDRDNNYLHVLGRLRPGVSLEEAEAEMGVITARLEREYPKENEQTGAMLLPLRDYLPERSRLLLLGLCGAALCILLIACANLANLLLARTLARQKELALRTALGAGRERLVRQLLTETIVLAGVGGGLGTLVAAAALPLLARLVPDTLPIGQSPALDLRVLLVAGLITGITALGFGVLPALRAGRDTGLEGLREGARSGAGPKQRLRSALVIAEVMASVALLVSSGLLLRALWRIQSVDPGFRAEGVLTLRTALPWPKYIHTADRVEFYRRVLTEVRAIPGVERAAYISFLPMAMPGGIWPVSLGGGEADGQGKHSASLRFITPGFFGTLEIPLRTGRDVMETDRSDALAVAVVSESFVRRYWPNADPIGRSFDFAFQKRTVVGVVGDVMVRGLERSSEPQVYLPATQVPDSSIIFYTPKDLVVRSSLDPTSLVPAIRNIVRRADPEQPISNVRTMGEIVAEETTSRAVQVRLLGSLAALALLLAGVGIHGLLSYSVSTRARELGVRIALGAQRRDILRMVLGQAVRLAGVGVLLGVALAYSAARGMAALLASVGPADGVTLLVAGALCLAMAAAGCWFPALRAVRTDPIAAIKAE